MQPRTAGRLAACPERLADHVIRGGCGGAGRMAWRYLTDEAVRDLARMMAVTVAGEAPGADVLASPRTAAVPVPVVGRCIAGLSEAIVLRLTERDDLGHVRTTTAQLAQALSALGQVIVGEHNSSYTAAGIAGPVVVARLRC